MATLATPITTAEERDDPSCTKVVCTEDGRALYFSRAPIPFVRDDTEHFLQSAAEGEKRGDPWDFGNPRDLSPGFVRVPNWTAPLCDTKQWLNCYRYSGYTKYV